jgi:hypothetical protein
MNSVLKLFRATDTYKDYGNRSSVDPPYSVAMRCDVCKTKWIGCWDNYECPECGEGELPSSELTHVLF